MFNINNSLIEKGKTYNLSPIATGGGCDFMWRGAGELVEMDGYDSYMIDLVLGSKADVGVSPDSLSEPSIVGCYIGDPEWQDGIFINFDTAEEAMKFMASVETADDIYNKNKTAK